MEAEEGGKERDGESETRENAIGRPRLLFLSETESARDGVSHGKSLPKCRPRPCLAQPQPAVTYSEESKLVFANGVFDFGCRRWFD